MQEVPDLSTLRNATGHSFALQCTRRNRRNTQDREGDHQWRRAAPAYHLGGVRPAVQDTRRECLRPFRNCCRWHGNHHPPRAAGADRQLPECGSSHGIFRSEDCRPGRSPSVAGMRRGRGDCAQGTLSCKGILEPAWSHY